MSLPITPISIPISEVEAKAQRLSSRNVELATYAIHRDGLVIVEDLVPHHVLDKLNVKMIEDAYRLQSRKDSPFNYNKGNIQQDPPLTAEWFSEEIFLIPIVAQITSHTLGPMPQLRFISGNTALPPAPDSPPSRQPTHSDADFAHPSHPFALVVNVPLVTMTPENGSTEIWLGTHQGAGLADQEGRHGERASGRIQKALLEERKQIRAPCQPVVKKGSVVIRDLRLWHGGCPNMTQDPRVMLAMIHFAPWYRNQMDVEFAEELRDRLTPEKTGVQIAARYVNQEEVERNYLNRPYGNAYDFDQVDKIEGLS